MCVVNGESRPDNKHRGGFIFQDEEFSYHCFNCKFVTGWKLGSRLGWKVKSLLRQLGTDESDIQRLVLQLLQEDETVSLVRKVAPKQLYKPIWKEIELPTNAKRIDLVDSESDLFYNAISMLSNRNLLNWTDWYYTDSDWKFKNRIILPYYYKNKLVGYNARYTKDLPPNMPKYIVQKPKNFIFNLDMQGSAADHQFVIVHEGDFDAIGTNGVSLGTNAASEAQCSILDQLNRRVILLPDGDSAGANLIETAIKEEWSVSFPEWLSEHKDANSAIIEYGRAFVIKSIISSAIDNVTKIKVLAKRYCV